MGAERVFSAASTLWHRLFMSTGQSSVVAMSVMATGHRSIHHPAVVREALVAVLGRWSARAAICGGAEGADTLFAEAALSSETPIDVYLPNRYYRDHYPNAIPDELLAAARRVTYVVDRPDVDDWRRRWRTERWWRDNHARNYAMVDLADRAIVVARDHPWRLLGQEGGTAACVRSLRGRGVRHVWWVPDRALDAEPRLVTLTGQRDSQQALF